MRAALVDRAAAVIAADHERGNMTVDAAASLEDTRRAAGGHCRADGGNGRVSLPG